MAVRNPAAVAVAAAAIDHPIDLIVWGPHPAGLIFLSWHFRISGLLKCALSSRPVRKRSNIMKEQHIEVEGCVHTVLPGTMFRVELDNKHLVLATISGKMRKRFVRLTIGDRVKMEMSPYDLEKARITWRLR